MTNEEALKILDTIPTISEQVDALEMAIKALETIPKYKDAYNKGYEAGVKATNVDCGVVWEERIDAIKENLRMIDASCVYKVWTYDEIIRLINKHCGGDKE